ncbi:MAG: metalloregulator ArsR/SmtB family transcription factor [Dongiaceae bacterium]
MTRDDQLLLLLKTEGPLTVGHLVKRLKLTPQGLRRRLEALAADALVEATTERAGVGRPRKCWRLTPDGDARFPDRHDELVVDLIEQVRRELGPAALDRLIAGREAAQRRRYAAALPAQATLPERTRRLARLRSEEGYMAEVRRADGGGLLLIEHHCPICAAAKTCQGFCRSELDVFRSVLGPDVSVERESHIVAGAPRCVYRVQPRATMRSGGKHPKRKESQR